MKKIVLAAAALALAAPTAPAWADPPPWAPAHGKRAKEHRHGERYYEPRRLRRGDRIWQGDDGRYYCRRDDGTTGLIIGAAAGALLGRALDGGRSRTVGTLLGGAAGALLGREIDRGSVRCR